MDTPALFSTILLESPEQDLPEPTNGPYFVATKTGYMVYQDTHWGRVLVPVKEAPSLPTSQSLYWHDINLPADIIGQAWGFFRAVFEKQKSEAMVDITWHKNHGYRLFVPPQETTGGGVQARRIPEHYRGQIVGTIHSHCDFGAYHSGTDTHDAEGHDGLHMTIGHVTADHLDIAILLSANGVRWENIKLTDVVNNPDQISPLATPAWWMNLVDKPKPAPTPPPTPFTKPKGSENGHQLTTWYGRRTAPTTESPSHIIIGNQPKRNHPMKFTSLDGLSYSLNRFDPRLDLIDEIQQNIDLIASDLDNLGIDFDYEVSPSFDFEFVDHETSRLEEALRDMENRS